MEQTVHKPQVSFHYNCKQCYLGFERVEQSRTLSDGYIFLKFLYIYSIHNRFDLNAHGV